MVTDSPRTPARRIASSALGASPGATSKANERQRAASPRAANALLWSSGESEWATGLPMTPTIVTSGPDSWRASSIVGTLTGGSGEPTGLRQLLVGQLFGKGVGEGERAVLLHQHEVAPPTRWRVHRRRQRIG